MSDETEILLRVKTESAEIKKLEKDFGTLKIQVERSADAAEQLGVQLQMAAELADISKMIAQMASLQAAEARLTAEKRAQNQLTRQNTAQQQALTGAMRGSATQAGRIASESRKIAPALSSARGAADNLGISLGGVMKTLGALAALRALTGAFSIAKDTATDGVGFNAQVETATLGIASVLRQFNPERFKDFDSAASKSVQIVQQLKVAALQTAAGFDELLEGFQGSAGAMASANIPLDKQVGLMVRMSQTLTALGIQSRELRQESTALLMGRIDQNARAAKTLGITAEDINRAKEQGTLYEFLMQRMVSFGEAANRAAMTVNVLQSNLRDAAVQQNAAATVELTEAYRGLLVALTEFVTSDAYKDFVSTFLSPATSMVGAVRDATQYFNNTAKTSPGQKLRTYEQTAQGLAQEAGGATTPEQLNQIIGRANFNLRALAKDVDAEPKMYFAQDVANIRSMFKSLISDVQNRGGDLLRTNVPAAEKAKAAELEIKALEEARKAREKAVQWLSTEGQKIREKAAENARDLMTDKERITTLDALIGKVKSKAALELQSAGSVEERQMIELKLQDELLPLLKEREATEKRITTEVKQRVAETEKELEAADRARAKKLKDLLEDEQRARQASIGSITGNRYMTDKQKQAKLYGIYQAEAGALPGQISAVNNFANQLPADSPTRVAAEAEANRLRDRQAFGNPADLQANQPTSIGQDTLAQVTQLQNGFMTVADAVGITLKSAIDSVSESMVGLIQGTMTWGEALQNIGSTIMTSVLQAISRMFVEYITGLILKATIGKALQAAAIAASIPMAAASSAIWATPATLATIATFGGAAAAAPLQILGATTASKAFSLYEDGGFTPSGRNSQLVGGVHANEWVAPEWMVSDPFYGRQIAAMEQARMGNLTANSGMGGGAAVSGGVYGGGSPMAGPATSESGFSQAFFNTQQEAEDWLRSRSGRRVMTNFMDQQSYDLP